LRVSEQTDYSIADFLLSASARPFINAGIFTIYNEFAGTGPVAVSLKNKIHIFPGASQKVSGKIVNKNIVSKPQVMNFLSLQPNRSPLVYNQVVVKIIVADAGCGIVVMSNPDGAGLVFPDIIKYVVADDIFFQPLCPAPLP
jgi:hypothetical protein